MCLGLLFQSIPRNIDRDLNSDRTYKVDTKTEGNIFGIVRKNSYYCIYCSDRLKTYLRESKLFEFSGDTKGVHTGVITNEQEKQKCESEDEGKMIENILLHP